MYATGCNLQSIIQMTNNARYASTYCYIALTIIIIMKTSVFKLESDLTPGLFHDDIVISCMNVTRPLSALYGAIVDHLVLSKKYITAEKSFKSLLGLITE